MQAKPPTIFLRAAPSEGPFLRRNISQLPERLRRSRTDVYDPDAGNEAFTKPDFTRFQCGGTPLPRRTQLPGGRSLQGEVLRCWT